MHGNRASKSFDYVIVGAGVAGLHSRTSFLRLDGRFY